MAYTASLQGRQRRQLAVMVGLTLIFFYFGYHLVSGSNGLLAIMQLSSKLDQAQGRLDEVKMDRLKLQHRVKLMSNESLDLDLLDEQARKVLGYARKDEIIYFPPETDVR